MSDACTDRPGHLRDESQRSAIDPVRAYHETTKHRLKAYAPGPGFLDWDCQPDPFRRWPQITRVLPAAVNPDLSGTEVLRATQTPAMVVTGDASVDTAALIRSRCSAQRMTG